MTLFTVGHGTHSAESFATLLRDAGVRSLVDVRTAPGSRRWPHFNRAELEQWLPASGVRYRWEKALGGFRKPAPDSVNAGWRNTSFRGYADYTRTPEFWAALDPLLAAAAEEPTAVMCSESVWWRCHRRVVADAALVVRGVEVVHLMPDGSQPRHQPTPGVERDGDLLRYPAPAMDNTATFV